jgi:membrane protein required for colicin V production
MNWLDAILGVALLVCLVNGFRRGFSRQVIGLASGVVALLLGIWLYGTAGAWLLPYVSSPVIAKAAGFAIVFCGVLLLGGLISFVVGKFLTVTGLSFFDHLLGAGFGLLRWAIVAIAIVMSAMAFSRGDRAPDAIVESRLAPYVVDVARLVAAMAPHDLKAGFHKTYDQVKAAWGSAIDKGIRSMPDGGKSHARQL